MFCKLSQKQEKHVKITIDGLFVTEYMPQAPENAVKVYLMGLTFAMGGDTNNSIENVCKKLNLEESEVRSLFRYWANEGVVNVNEEDGFCVEYLPLDGILPPIRKFSKTKYAEFNNQLHAMLPTRQILPAEYNEYYSVIEDCHLEPLAMLAIISYCIRLKGESISSKYIVSVARNMAEKGLLTFDRVNEELSQYDAYSPITDKIMKALSSKKLPDHEDKNLVIKWTKIYGFSVDTIIAVAKNHVKKGNFEKLDRKLTKFYENHLFSIEEIDAYIENRDKLYELTYSINRIIGVYYDQVDYIVENYVSLWVSMGYGEKTLKTIAEYCFRKNVKTIEGMNDTVNKFYKQGVITEEALSEYLARSVATDNTIKEVLSTAGVNRMVTSRDRDAYRTWSQTWKFNNDLILYAASLSKGTNNPISYVNTLLSTWLSKGIDSIEKAKQTQPAPSVTTKNTVVEKSYTSEQLNAMFDNLDYEDL